MANVFDYLAWRGDLLLSQAPINEIDAVIFSRLSYLPFGKAVSADISQTILLKDTVEIIQPALADGTYPQSKEDQRLLEVAARCPRFAALGVSGFVEVIDLEREEQFSATVFHLSHQLIFIAYRGTDDTLVGWKENFNMGFMSPVPAQKDAVHYLEQVAQALPNHEIIIGGHSKGGNLAVYAAAFCDPTLQSRILAVYNNDGPGFNNQTIEQAGFAAIRSKVHTFVPQSSVVGMLLERREPYTIIKSQGVSLYQHNLYLWEVAANHFIRLEEVTDSSKFFDQTVKTWVRGMDEEQLEHFVEALFQVLGSTEAQTTTQLSENWYESTKSILSTLHNIDPKSQAALSTAFHLLWQAASTSWDSLSAAEEKKSSSSSNPKP